MVIGESSINNIMGGIENTGIRLHNHKRKLKQRFDIIKKLGQGTYGKVQLGINKETGQEVAIKTIKKSKIESEADLIRIRREIQIMSSVQHPNIIHIYEVFENKEKMVLVMEYAAGGELYDYLSERKVLSEDEARRIFRQIATACYYCHKHKICHRDLKLENILLDEYSNAKIADFGLSNVFDDQRLLSTFCGSPLYASPEIVRGTPYNGPEVDCWSLGVLLYTLVYGAMPFDGSNFKRLVKQISQGDYFEPQKPSPASPLIKEMLTVNPKHRANIEKICAHWWVNESYDESCLVISEELANQTPVRLDLLLSLAPPPPQLESDKLVVTGEVADDVKAESMVPTRSQSVGSLMELAHPAEKRIIDLIKDEKGTPKRKLESTLSTDRANLSSESLKRKDKIIKENTIADITMHGTIQENASMEDASMAEDSKPEKSSTQTISREMEVETAEETPELSSQGAACQEIIKEEQQKKPVKVKKVAASKAKVPDEKVEVVTPKADKENVETNKEKAEEKVEATKPVAKKKVLKKKVLTDKNSVETKPAKEVESKPVKETETKPVEVEQNGTGKPSEGPKEVVEAAPEEAPPKPVERRRSKIFETAEKFQNMITSSDSKSAVPEKPKKIIIPGVSVGGFKKEFERKASLTSSASSLSKKNSIEKEPSIDNPPEEAAPVKEEKEVPKPPTEEPPVEAVPDEQRKEKVKNAVNIITSALDKEGTRKSRSRPCMTRKPPVPFGTGGRSASGSIGLIPPPLSPTEDKRFLKVQVGPNDTRTAIVEVSTPEHTRFLMEPLKHHQQQQQAQQQQPEEQKTSSAEITLKSATLPRRKTAKAEIRLDYPVPKPATMEFKTEMAHRVEAPPKVTTQRSEVTFPVTSPPPVLSFRATSLEPRTEAKNSPKERIIPISFEKSSEVKAEKVQSPPAKPPTPKAFQTQKSSQSQRSNSLSRQSTQESDSDTTPPTGEPIRKSPREFIIPIAVEGGGYVTPRAGSLEPSETGSTSSTLTGRSSKFSGARRMTPLLNDREGSEDESPFSALHRHSSFGRDSDNEDSRRDTFHMHRLRSSRPRKATLEHNDSLSSGEDDDDDGFEILTAENLFSTLLSRVRDLTQRLNVEDGGRPGFPSGRLLSHFDHGTNFWNLHNRLEPMARKSPVGSAFGRERASPSANLSRQFSTPWRRSVSRDLASDIESVFKDSNTPTHVATLPRGDEKSKMENLNLSDLDLKKLKLSDEDALALSYLTPGLSKRIQKQLLAQLAPSEARKLSRTLSMRNPKENLPENEPETKLNSRRSVERMSSTLPRRFSAENDVKRNDNFNADLNKNKYEMDDGKKSFLPVKSKIRDTYSPYKERSVYEPEINSSVLDSFGKSLVNRSGSLREPRIEYKSPRIDYSLRSPDSSLSESLSSYKNDDLSDSSRLYSSDLSPTRSKSSYSKYSPESSSLTKYLSPNKYLDTRSYIPSVLDTKTEIRRPSISTKRVSRFLRPDFYETPKEENSYVKEKKEREMETQKVLKEIRDKRIKNRLNLRRERSASRSRTENTETVEINGNVIPETDAILKDVSDNIKVLESNVKSVPDYVNVKSTDGNIPDYVNVTVREESPVKKERISKLVRPKSYPTESPQKELEIQDPKSKLLKKTIVKPKTSTKSTNDNQSTKNKLLQTLEKKICKFRATNSVPNKVEDTEKKSNVENVIKRLREQSLPRNLDQITESGLIKRAVSVEDMHTSNSKPLQTSRKSVTKILGLFKKYEERDKKKDDKVVKMKKVKDNDSGANAQSVINNNEEKKTKSVKKRIVPKEEPTTNGNADKKPDRPRSLLFDRVQRFQNATDGATSDLSNANTSEVKSKSKLPINAFRRSLNLENTPKVSNENIVNNNVCEQPDRRKLKLDFTKIPEPKIIVETAPGEIPTDAAMSNRNSLTTDDSSVLLSPCDDNVSCDSWSVSSDYNTHDLTSPISPNGYLCSGDEGESVIDRIRRKSFYSRFNEKKKPRRPSGNYRDLDLYKDYRHRTPGDYSSLDRRSVDYRKYNSDSGGEYYPRNYSSLNDGLTNRYQTYNPRASQPRSSMYLDSANAENDAAATGKSRKYSTLKHPSMMVRKSASPTLDGEQFNNNAMSGTSLIPNSVTLPKSQSSI